MPSYSSICLGRLCHKWLHQFYIIGREDSHSVLNLAFPPVILRVGTSEDLDNLAFPKLQITLHLATEVVECHRLWKALPVWLLGETVLVDALLLWGSSSTLGLRGSRLSTTDIDDGLKTR